MLKTIKNQPFYVFVFALLTLAIVVFIWSNSFESKPESLDKSLFITEILRPLIEPIVGKGIFDVNLVRKLAHVAEYAGLGFMTMLTVLSFRCGNKSKRLSSLKFKIPIALIFCLVVSSIDEIIQIFTLRGPQVTDVLLDTVSAGVACLIVLGIYWLISKVS